MAGEWDEMGFDRSWSHTYAGLLVEVLSDALQDWKDLKVQINPRACEDFRCTLGETFLEYGGCTMYTYNVMFPALYLNLNIIENIILSIYFLTDWEG